MKKKKESNTRIIVLSISAAVFILASSYIIVDRKYKKAVEEERKAKLSQQFQEMLDEELRISHENMEKNRNYVVNNTAEVGGKTIYYVSDPTPTPTQTPTPTPVYSRYYNIDSEEFIGAEDGIYHEKEKELNLDFYTENEMIAFYSKVFQLDDKKVGNKIYELIELNEDAWNEENILNGKQYSSKEQAIAKTIADISNYPSKYDLTDINVDKYELKQYKPEELIGKFSDVIGVDKELALAVACGESGPKFDSYNFKHNHNVGGLHKRKNDPHPTTSGGFIIFKNEAEGLYRYVEILYNNFSVRIYSDKEEGLKKIKSMSYTYCQQPSYWENLVGGIYRKLKSNGYEYYYNKYNYSRDLVYPTKEKYKVYKK